MYKVDAITPMPQTKRQNETKKIIEKDSKNGNSKSDVFESSAKKTSQNNSPEHRAMQIFNKYGAEAYENMQVATEFCKKIVKSYKV